jgi:hypothetical protein
MMWRFPGTVGAARRAAPTDDRKQGTGNIAEKHWGGSRAAPTRCQGIIPPVNSWCTGRACNLPVPRRWRG